MNKFCVITNRDKDTDLAVTSEIVDYMNKNHKECLLLEGQNPVSCSHRFTDAKAIPEDTECAIVLGGDGTIIQAANDLAGKGIPILGVNLGTLGFLAETEKHNIYEALDSLFADQCGMESRMMLHGSIFSSSKKAYEGIVLNDIVITRSGFSRIISVSIYVNDELVDRYRGDGVIISTPTGSTGYNLSSGGPVVKPDARVMIITPICPHTLNSRSIVVSSEDSVKIKIDESKKTQEEEAIATFDGRMAILLQAEDIIDISKAQEETKLVKINHTSFFNILRTKIGQGGE
ncbi:NAD(+)/NADH kinase [Anaerocolumna sp. AGMB13025]|uniref:NAD(+)/NADH kinase n=1 Tax=Anaerocolumna sp. AGMB13025 TaxID=3039116 RepID=UPI00241ECE83|nr:NAD(+)/NADH kinase [Anaerocolumna sp. AGMB13025]WFR59644.1 NAD(+)/NADH kinase [Anaerocolumna sp. AGMB13025]